jgi:acetyltransferase
LCARASYDGVMSIRNFDALFAPGSVALLGASDKEGTVGAVLLQNAVSAGFTGELMLVNPRHRVLGGRTVFPDVASLPSTPDLAVVAIPPEQVVAAIGDLARRGTKAAIVLTAGFGELGERGTQLQREMVAAAAATGMRILGPNCVGLIVPPAGLNLSFAPGTPPSGDVAFVSQSGGLVTVVLDWAQPRGIGFSRVVSLGDMADVDFGDVLEYLAGDDATRAITLYVEGITDAPKFLAAARRVARAKPIVALKVGRNAAGARAARSHTGALAGSDVVYDAAFRRAGIVRVGGLPELFDAIEMLALSAPLDGDRLAILTNGGGPGVIATDALVGEGGRLAQLSPATLARLDAVLPATWSRGNPVDMIGDTPAATYGLALDALLGDDGVDGVLVLHAPTALADPREPAEAVVATVCARAANPVRANVLAAWLGGRLVEPARRVFAAARVPSYETPEDAVHGFLDRARYARMRTLAAAEMLPPSGVACNAPAARAALERAGAAGRTWLDAGDVDAVFRAYGIPTIRSRSVPDAESAARAADELGGAVALKIRSPQITHKSDVGGVALGLEGHDAVLREAQAMRERIASLRPDAAIEGFLVQELVRRPNAIELIVGLSVDAAFGPVVLFGHGGTAVELIADTSLELAPLDRSLALAQIARTRVARLLGGYRDVPPADLDAIVGVLVRIGRLAVECPALRELDINPLLADAAGVIALDARIMISPPVLAARADPIARGARANASRARARPR